MHSDYQSVQEQTGLLAGQGGFDVTVGTSISSRCLRAESFGQNWRRACITSGFAEGGLTVSIRQPEITRSLATCSRPPRLQR